MGPKKKGSSKSPKSKGKKDSKTTKGSTKSKSVVPSYPVWEHDAQIKYRLSNELFLALGWSAPADERHLKTVVTYKTHYAKPHMALFKLRDEKEIRYYPDRTKMAVLKKNATGTIYYPGGGVAIIRQKAHRCARIIVVSPGGVDPKTGLKRVQTISAIFDSIGNGVVYDEDGKIRLIFTQKQGVLIDTPNGLPRKWTWPIKFDAESKVLSSNTKTVPLPPDPTPEELLALQAIQTNKDKQTNKKTTSKLKKKGSTNASMKDNKSELNEKNTASENNENKDPPEEEEEYCESVVLDTKKHLSTMKQFRKEHMLVRTPLKPICLPLSEYVTLRMTDQASVNLVFSAQKQILRLELGVIVDPTEHTHIDKTEPKKWVAADGVMNFFEQFPRKSLTKVMTRLGRQRERSVVRMIKKRQMDAISGKTAQFTK